jgi:Transposase DDE domain
MGRARHLKGHCYVCAAHLYRHASRRGARWASVLCGALLYVKGRSIPELVGQLARQLRLPEGVRHVWVVDRGILSRPCLLAVSALEQFVLGRLRSNHVVYFAPRRQPRRGRPRAYGQKCRVDRVTRRFPDRVREQRMVLRVRGRDRMVRVYDAPVLLRGVFSARALPARVIVIEVPGLKLKPWYLVTTDMELDPLSAVRAYDGRYQIETNFDEVKELGLGHYQGRSGRGVRRWPLFLCVAQMLLKFVATGVLPVELPELNWSWYGRENTVGQVRRRLIELCRPRLSRMKTETPTMQKMREAA